MRCTSGSNVPTLSWHALSAMMWSNTFTSHIHAHSSCTAHIFIRGHTLSYSAETFFVLVMLPYACVISLSLICTGLQCSCNRSWVKIRQQSSLDYMDYTQLHWTQKLQGPRTSHLQRDNLVTKSSPKSWLFFFSTLTH